MTAKTGSRTGGQSAAAHADYIAREGQHERGDDDDVVHRESGHMPEWAQDDPRTYWAAADAHERANGRLYRDIEFALPKELSRAPAGGPGAGVRGLGDHRQRRAVALHAGRASWRGGEPPRASDVLRAGERRHRAQRRAVVSSAQPQGSGPGRGQEIQNDEAEGVARGHPRANWAQQANRALARAGRSERIHAGSLAQQLTEAERRGDAGEISRLAHREPGVHLGPHNVARAERGEPLDRTADAVSVVDRNQELAAERADVSRMEQALQHVRNEITKAVKALADLCAGALGAAKPAGAACAGAGRPRKEPQLMGSALDRVRTAQVENEALKVSAKETTAALQETTAELTGPKGGAEVASASHQARAGAGAGTEAVSAGADRVCGRGRRRDHPHARDHARSG